MPSLPRPMHRAKLHYVDFGTDLMEAKSNSWVHLAPGTHRIPATQAAHIDKFVRDLAISISHAGGAPSFTGCAAPRAMSPPSFSYAAPSAAAMPGNSTPSVSLLHPKMWLAYERRFHSSGATQALRSLRFPRTAFVCQMFLDLSHSRCPPSSGEAPWSERSYGPTYSNLDAP
jgi:hypothetical protein